MDSDPLRTFSLLQHGWAQVWYEPRGMHQGHGTGYLRAFGPVNVGSGRMSGGCRDVSEKGQVRG